MTGELLESAAMRRAEINKRLSTLLAALLLFAQAGALAHAYEHDPGSPQSQICSTCIAAHAVSSACVDTSHGCDLPVYRAESYAAIAVLLRGADLPHARQRAPPTPL
jgi:hypothetical protein